MFHTATKLTVIAERLLEEDILKILSSQGASGYTILEGAGKGEHFTRMSDRASIVSAFSIIKIEVIFTDRERAETAAKEIHDKHFEYYSGVVHLSQIEVIRPERF